MCSFCAKERATAGYDGEWQKWTGFCFDLNMAPLAFSSIDESGAEMRCDALRANAVGPVCKKAPAGIFV